MSPSRPTVRAPSVGAADVPSPPPVGVPEQHAASARVSAAHTATPRSSRVCIGDSFVRLGKRKVLRRFIRRPPSDRRAPAAGRHEVGQDVDRPEHERDPGNRWEVGDRDRSGQVVADAGPREDLFDDNHAGEHESELQTAHRQGRPHGVPHHVVATTCCSVRPLERAVRTSSTPRTACSDARNTLPIATAGATDSTTAGSTRCCSALTNASVWPCSRVSSACIPNGPGSWKSPTPLRQPPSWPKNTMMPTIASRNGGTVASSSRSTPGQIEAPGHRSAPDIAYNAASSSAMRNAVTARSTVLGR